MFSIMKNVVVFSRQSSNYGAHENFTLTNEVEERRVVMYWTTSAIYCISDTEYLFSHESGESARAHTALTTNCPHTPRGSRPSHACTAHTATCTPGANQPPS